MFVQGSHTFANNTRIFPQMPNHIPEIALLLEEVEKKYGRKVSTSTDFESLSVVIEHETGEYLSSSTLKRLGMYPSNRLRVYLHLMYSAATSAISPLPHTVRR